jgi:tRNA(Arg) A34 adenosine deaminase TadA
MIEMFQMALEYATRRQDERLFLLGTVAIRGSDQKIVKSRNLPVMIDQDVMSGYNTRYPYPHKHSEANIIAKITPKTVIWNARGRKLDGRFAMARPCQTCETLLGYAGVEKVYYTISELEYGVMFLKSKKDDRIYQF